MWCQPTPSILSRSVATTVGEAASVYLRRKTVRKNRKTHEYWLLVRSVRQGRRMRQEIVALRAAPLRAAERRAEGLAQHPRGCRGQALSERRRATSTAGLTTRICEVGRDFEEHTGPVISKDDGGSWLSEESIGVVGMMQILLHAVERLVAELIACCDGLRNSPEAIESLLPKATVQTCIVHMIRNSLRYVSYEDRKAVVRDLKPIYTATNRIEAEAALTAFEAKWGRRHEMISSSWRTNWERVVPFLDFLPEVRRGICTTDQIEALNSSLRKLLQCRGHFRHDEAVTKILYLAPRRMEKTWERSLWNRSALLGKFAVFFQGRIPAP